MSARCPTAATCSRSACPRSGTRSNGRTPLTVTGHYLSPAAPGPITILVEPIKRGRSYSTGMARLMQADREMTRVLATFGTLGSHAGMRYITGKPPSSKS